MNLETHRHSPLQVEKPSWSFIFLLCCLPFLVVKASSIFAVFFIPREFLGNSIYMRVFSFVFLTAVFSTTVFLLRSHLSVFSLSGEKICFHIISGFFYGMIPLVFLKFILVLSKGWVFFSPDFNLHDPMQVIAMSALFLFPILEELYVRGILYSIVRKKGWGIFTAAVVASLSFALGHAGETMGRTVVHFVFSMILCVLYEKTGSLILTLSIHLGTNLSVVLI